MNFELNKFNRKKYYGLDGATINPNKVITNYVAKTGDILVPRGFKSNIYLKLELKGYVIVTSSSDVYLTKKQLKNILFEKKEYAF